MNKKELNFINENQLVSFMNKTKWRKLATELISHKEFRPKVKLLYLDDYRTGFSLLDWEWVLNGTTACIRWMEIDPIKKEYRGQLISDNETDFSEFIEASLKKCNIPYSLENGIYKVWGYIEPNNQPNFTST